MASFAQMEGLSQVFTGDDSVHSFALNQPQVPAMFAKALALCDDLELRVSRDQVGAFLSRLAAGRVTIGSSGGELRHLKSVILSELEARGYFHTSPQKAAYFDGALDQFGDDVRREFPASLYDIDESGRCYATGRYTACVFHLMRVMEAAIPMLARRLFIDVSASREWGPMLGDIRRGLTAQENAKALTRERKQYAHDVVAALDSVRIAWRNPTMHVQANYDDDRALEVFNAVRMLMRRLAAPAPV